MMRTKLGFIASILVLFGQAPALAQAPPPPSKVTLPPPSPYAQAFRIAVGDVLGKAPVPAGTRAELLIDPLIDGNTGVQSSSTRAMEAQIRQFVAASFRDKYEVKPFTPENVARLPLLLIGTFTPIHATAKPTDRRDAYRLCFALLDLKSKQIISKGFARATSDGIRAVPTPAFADSPFWSKDPAVDGYVRTCQGPKAGDPIHPNYVSRVDVAAVISQAIVAYDGGKIAAANALFKQARTLPGGDQLRVLNGLYLTSLKLGKQAEAEEALGALVDFGLKHERLGLMLLFTKNTANFVPGMISAAYPLWLRTVADKAASANVCLEVGGHASHTGPEAFNDELSSRRAETVKARLVQLSPKLDGNLKTVGKGWRENLVGTGRDDATDAIDRRVEFKMAKCG